MRIILKPGGYGVLLAAVAALTGLAVFNVRGRQVSAPSVSASLNPVKPTFAGLYGGASSVQDGDFSGQFVPARFLGNNAVPPKATMSGVIADPWLDNSDWADLAVHYDKDTDVTGRPCQRIDVGDVRFGKVQFVQFLRLAPASRYTLRARLKSSQPTVAQFGLHDLLGKFDDASSPKDVTLSSEWKEYTVTVDTLRSQHFLILGIDQPHVTVWISDVRMTQSAIPTK